MLGLGSGQACVVPPEEQWSQVPAVTSQVLSPAPAPAQPGPAPPSLFALVGIGLRDRLREAHLKFVAAQGHLLVVRDEVIE